MPTLKANPRAISKVDTAMPLNGKRASKHTNQSACASDAYEPDCPGVNLGAYINTVHQILF